MRILIKSALILDPRSVYHRMRRDLLISKGKIVEIGVNFYESRVKLIREEGLCISPAWVDLCTYFSNGENNQNDPIKAAKFFDGTDVTALKCCLDALHKTGDRLHILSIPTVESMVLIRQAKKGGLPVTCSVSVHHLWSFFHESVKPAATLFSENQTAFIEGLKDGTVDAICSHHFSLKEGSPTGVSVQQKTPDNMDATFCVVYTLLENHIDREAIVALFSWKPLSILSLDVPVIEEGNAAAFTLFSTKLNTCFSGRLGLSHTHPFLAADQTLRGKVIYL